VFNSASGVDKGHKCQSRAGEEERKTEQFSRKPNNFLFFGFYTIFTSLNFVGYVTSNFLIMF
jgi:hypothetical protein